MFQRMGVFAEFERSMIQARIKAGLDRARRTPRKGADLAELLGLRSRASEILSATRRFSLEMIGLLGRGWGIPADLLVPQPELEAA